MHKYFIIHELGFPQKEFFMPLSFVVFVIKERTTMEFFRCIILGCPYIMIIFPILIYADLINYIKLKSVILNRFVLIIKIFGCIMPNNNLNKMCEVGSNGSFAYLT